MSDKWPLYSGNSEVVNAIDITSVRQLVNGYGEITPTNSFPVVTVTDAFMQMYRPVATGYLVDRAGSPLFYMSKAAFEAVYTKSGTAAAWGDITGKQASYLRPDHRNDWHNGDGWQQSTNSHRARRRSSPDGHRSDY